MAGDLSAEVASHQSNWQTSGFSQIIGRLYCRRHRLIISGSSMGFEINKIFGIRIGNHFWDCPSEVQRLV